MNEQQLQELALQAQQHPLGTTARRITLSKLIDGIYRSGKLCHPYKGQFPGVYEQIYQEAVQDLFLYPTFRTLAVTTVNYGRIMMRNQENNTISILK